MYERMRRIGGWPSTRYEAEHRRRHSGPEAAGQDLKPMSIVMSRTSDSVLSTLRSARSLTVSVAELKTASEVDMTEEGEGTPVFGRRTEEAGLAHVLAVSGRTCRVNGHLCLSSATDELAPLHHHRAAL